MFEVIIKDNKQRKKCSDGTDDCVLKYSVFASVEETSATDTSREKTEWKQMFDPWLAINDHFDIHFIKQEVKQILHKTVDNERFVTLPKSVHIYGNLRCVHCYPLKDKNKFKLINVLTID